MADKGVCRDAGALEGGGACEGEGEWDGPGPVPCPCCGLRRGFVELRLVAGGGLVGMRDSSTAGRRVVLPISGGEFVCGAP